VEVVSLSNGTFTGQVEVPAVHYLSISNSGSRILGFSDNSDSVALITPSQIGIGDAVTYLAASIVRSRPSSAVTAPPCTW